MPRQTITITCGITCDTRFRMGAPVDLTILEGEHLAIVGDNAAGKSMLVDILLRRRPLRYDQPKYNFGTGDPNSRTYVSDHIRYITFRDSYGTSDATYYYQQRWNQHDTDGIPTAENFLNKSLEQAVSSQCIGHQYSPQQVATLHEQIDKRRVELYRFFAIEPLLKKAVIFLSSGELRKLQLTKALLTTPSILIIDNPFIGLDAPMRGMFNELLHKIAKETDTQLILVTPRSDEIPDYITHVVEVRNKTVGRKQTLQTFHPDLPSRINPQTAKEALRSPSTVDTDSLPADRAKTSQAAQCPVVALSHVTIRYGQHTILDDISWQVNEGECWAVTGRNGSGKSTLLSIICADNLQAYAHDVTLFGRKRGTGESIWDIKRNIGYVSPELHRAYQKDLPAIRVVASGLNDSVGLYANPSDAQLSTCRHWMGVFRAAHLAERPFLTLSSGEQRLVLLARAFVKDPPLLILDEPLHGLDLNNRAYVREVIEQYATQPHKTLLMVTHYDEELPPCITHRLTLSGGCATYETI